MEPMAVLSAISATLGIVDKFTDLVKKSRGEDVLEHRVQTRQKGEYLQILHDGHVAENIHFSTFEMSQWDFRELIDLHQNTLGVPLQDHYSLYQVCDDL